MQTLAACWGQINLLAPTVMVLRLILEDAKTDSSGQLHDSLTFLKQIKTKNHHLLPKYAHLLCFIVKIIVLTNFFKSIWEYSGLLIDQSKKIK